MIHNIKYITIAIKFELRYTHDSFGNDSQVLTHQGALYDPPKFGRSTYVLEPMSFWCALNYTYVNHI